MPELVDAARRRARDTPDALLIDAPAERRVVTAAALAADACATAAALRQLGIGPGHAVAAHVGNRTGYFSLLLACLDVGSALLPIDGSAPAAEAAAVAARFEASALVVPEAARARGSTCCRRGFGSPAAPIRHGRSRATAAGPVAMLKLTSGSTGVPKATVTTEAQIAADGRALSEIMGIRPDDWQVGAIPVSHSYALGNIVAPLLLQGTPVVLRDAFVPAQILDDAVRVGARLLRRRAVHVRSARGAAPRRLAMAGDAADDDLRRRAARSRDGARPSPAHRPAHPLALRDERDGRHHLRHRPGSRRRRGDGPARAWRDARVLA